METKKKIEACTVFFSFTVRHAALFLLHWAAFIVACVDFGPLHRPSLVSVAGPKANPVAAVVTDRIGSSCARVPVSRHHFVALSFACTFNISMEFLFNF